MEDLEPILVQSAMLIIPSLTAWLLAWVRVKTQRSVVEQATIEVEAAGYVRSMSGPAKKELAMTLARVRMGAFTRPSQSRLDGMVEAAVPVAVATVPPPARPDENAAG